jgi:hypothetical protein
VASTGVSTGGNNKRQMNANRVRISVFCRKDEEPNYRTLRLNPKMSFVTAADGSLRLLPVFQIPRRKTSQQAMMLSVSSLLRSKATCAIYPWSRVLSSLSAADVQLSDLGFAQLSKAFATEVGRRIAVSSAIAQTSFAI